MLTLSPGDYIPTVTPHFLWITEFPLFTRTDNEKEFLAQGRWSSTHHPFTAPMWGDIEAMYNGRLESVRLRFNDVDYLIFLLIGATGTRATLRSCIEWC
jgi:aspartyl-tRNA synthetase